MKHLRRHAAILLYLFLEANATCYNPHGDIILGDTACHSDGYSPCCGQGYACLSNGICKTTKYTVIDDSNTYGRGSCTDPTFKDAGCPLFCPGDNNFGVIKCEASGRDRYFCDNAETRNVSYPCGNPQYYFEFNGELHASNTVCIS